MLTVNGLHRLFSGLGSRDNIVNFLSNFGELAVSPSLAFPQLSILSKSLYQKCLPCGRYECISSLPRRDALLRERAAMAPFAVVIVSLFPALNDPGYKRRGERYALLIAPSTP